jgi:hypothetical protein
MVGAVDLHDQDSATAHDQDVRAPGVAPLHADTRERDDRDGVLLRETGLQALERPVDPQFLGAAERQAVLNRVAAAGFAACDFVREKWQRTSAATRGRV